MKKYTITLANCGMIDIPADFMCEDPSGDLVGFAWCLKGVDPDTASSQLRNYKMCACIKHGHWIAYHQINDQE